MQTQAQPVVGKHFYQFYQGKGDLFRVVFPFLRIGLENHEACLWIVSRSIGILEAIEAFQRQFDLSRYIEKGQLSILPAEQWYLDRGRFLERKVFQKIKRFMEDKKRLGFTTFRGAADAGWVAPEDWPEVQAYEAKVHQWLQTLPVVSLCFYPIQHSTLTQRKDVLERHDGVFLSKL
jgi:hypothetical protein